MTILTRTHIVYERREEIGVDPNDVRRSEKGLKLIRWPRDKDPALVAQLTWQDYCAVIIRQVSTGTKGVSGLPVLLTAPIGLAEAALIAPLIIDAALRDKIQSTAAAGGYVKTEKMPGEIRACATRPLHSERLKVAIPQIGFRYSFLADTQGLVLFDVTRIPGLIPMGEDTVITLALEEQADIRQEISLKSLMTSGLELLGKGSVEEAIQRFGASKILNPHYLPARYALIAALQRKEDLEGAEREAKESLSIQPDDTEVILTLASIYRQQNRFVEAVREVEKVHKHESLTIAFEAENPLARKTVVWALGEMKEPRAVEWLIVALKSKYQDVKEEARSALPKIEEPWAVEPLVTALQDEHPYIRTLAARTLGRIGDLRAVEPLTAALKDSDSSVQQEAVWALRKTADPRAVEALILALRDESPYVRKTVAQALGELKTPRAVASLTAALKDDDRDVRQTAAEALAKILE